MLICFYIKNLSMIKNNWLYTIITDMNIKYLSLNIFHKNDKKLSIFINIKHLFYYSHDFNKS